MEERADLDGKTGALPKICQMPAIRRIGEGRRGRSVDPERPGAGRQAGEREAAVGRGDRAAKVVGNS